MLFLLLLTTGVFAQVQKAEYTFKVSVSNITRSQPPTLNDRINYGLKTTELRSGEDFPLFYFKDNSNPAKGRVTLYYNKHSGQLFFDFIPDDAITSKKNLYNLFYTKARLRNGSNVLKVTFQSNLIWITCNHGTNESDLVDNNNTGEGILWYCDMSLLGDTTKLITPPETHKLGITLHTTSRRLSTSYLDDPVFDAYGYDEDDLDQPVQLGNSLDFDGVNDYVAVTASNNYPSGNSNYTLEAWIKPNTHATNGIIGWGEWWDNGKVNALRLGANNTIHNYWWGNDLIVTSGNLADGAWHHIAATFDGTTRKIYVDGVLKGQDNPTGHNVVRMNNIAIGRTYTGEYFNGKIDEVCVWNVARTQQQLVRDMNLVKDDNDTGLVAYYNFDEGIPCSNNTGLLTVPDVVGNNTGTPYNFAFTGTASNIAPGVNPPSYDTLCVGSTMDLDNYKDGGVWSSSNTSIATVNSTGEVTGISAGTAVINYTVTYDGGCTAVSSSTITVVGLPSETAIFGNALHFNDVNDNVSINNTIGNFGTGNFTVEMNVKTTAANQYIISKRAVCGHSNFWNLFLANGKLVAEFDENTSAANYVTLSGNTAINDGQWHHVAVARENSTLKIYIDGVLDASAACLTNVNNTNMLQLGTNVCQNISSYVGAIDEVRIWTIARTPEQLKASRLTELSGKEYGLVAYYNFNIGAASANNAGKTTLTDKAGNNNGTLSGFNLSGAVSNWVPGAVIPLQASPSNGLYFDGVDDYVSVPVNTNMPVGNEVYSIEAWIKPTVHTSNGIVGWGNWGTTNQTTDLRLSDNYTVRNGWYNTELSVTSGNLADGQWHHVAATFDGTTRKIYVDGVLKGQDNPTGHNVPFANNLKIGTIGTPALNNVQNFNGSIDEVRIWKTARTQTEILNTMYKELTGNETGLAAYYDFNSGVPGGNNTGVSILTDRSTNYNTGILTNFTLTGTTSNWVVGGIAASGIELCAGGSFQLNNALADDNWSSSNGSVATIDSAGLVRGFSAGTTSISFANMNAGGCITTSAVNVNIIEPVVEDNKANALQFDGVNDYVNINNTLGNFGTGDFTVEMNIKTTGTVKYVIAKRAICNHSNFWNFFINSAGLFAAEMDESSTGTNYMGLAGTTAVNDGKWHHAAVVRESGVLKIYIDGKLENTAPAVTNLNNTNMLQLGNICASNQNFPGAIDELRFWKRARTQDEIQQFMNIEINEHDSDMLAYYKMNHGIANGTNTGVTTLADVTGYGNNGTLVNFALSGTASNWVTGGATTSATTICAGATVQLNNATAGGVWTSSNTSIATVNSAGVVTASSTNSGTASISYTVTSPGGCTNASITSVTIDKAPLGTVDGYAQGSAQSSSTVNSIFGWAFDFNLPDYSIPVYVYNDNVYVTTVIANVSRPDVNAAYGINGRHGYDFVIPAQFLTGNMYTFKFYASNYPDVNNCGNTLLGSITFKYCPPPAKPVISPAATTICSGSSVTLSTPTVAGYTYKWSTTPNGTSIGSQASLTVSPSVSTTYYVTVYNSCNVSSTSDSAMVNVSTGAMATMSSSSGAKQVAVSPSGKIYIILSDNRVYRWNGSSWTRISDFIYASSIAVDNLGRLWFVANDGTNEIYYISTNASGMPTGNSTEFYGSSALKVACGANGTVAIIDLDHHIWKWNGNVGTGSNSASFTKHPYTYAGDVAVDASGRIWYVDGQYHGISYLNSSNQWVTLNGYAANQVSCGKDGTVYVTGWSNNSIYKWNGNTAFNIESSLGNANTDLAVYQTNTIVKIDANWVYKSDCFSGTGSKFSVDGENGGISEAARNETDSRFRVYPNPNTGFFTVSFHLSQASPVNIRLVDVQGRVVYQEAKEAGKGSNEYGINIMNIIPGIYYLQVSAAEFSKTEKLLIEK